MKHILQKGATILTGILLGTFLFVVSAHAQQTQYPISQLGNCRDTQECFYYCQIPNNFPACWSYGKYILNHNVLGDSIKSPEEIAREHGVTFPVEELGNCASPEACMTYCSQPANESSCADFGRKKGLTQDNNSVNQQHEQKILADAKQMLGCDSKDSCLTYCNDPANQQICQQFAQKEGFSQHNNNDQQNNQQNNNGQEGNNQTPQITTDMMKQGLGCDSQASCLDFCNHPENYDKCEAFAEKYHLNSSQQSQDNNPQQSQSSSSNIQTPPCTDQQSCMQWCKDNPDKCHPNQGDQQNQNDQHPQPLTPYPSYMRGGYIMQQEPPQGYPTYYPNQPNQQNNYQPPCTDDQSCNQYCQSHPTQCPGFVQNNSVNENNGYMQPSPYQQHGQFQQPTGLVQPNMQPSTYQQPPQPQSNTQPPSSSGYTTQQQMCTQTPGCSWTGSTCSCSSGH